MSFIYPSISKFFPSNCMLFNLPDVSPLYSFIRLVNLLSISVIFGEVISPVETIVPSTFTPLDVASNTFFLLVEDAPQPTAKIVF